MKQTAKNWNANATNWPHQVNKLRETIELIAKWNSHTTELAVNHGSSGVRDFYRRIAESSTVRDNPIPRWQHSKAGSRLMRLSRA